LRHEVYESIGECVSEEVATQPSAWMKVSMSVVVGVKNALADVIAEGVECREAAT
jgi:hypothetical protein